MKGIIVILLAYNIKSPTSHIKHFSGANPPDIFSLTSLIPETSGLSPKGNCRKEVKTGASIFLDSSLSFHPNIAIELTYSLSSVLSSSSVTPQAAFGSSRTVLRVDKPALPLQRTPPFDPQARGTTSTVSSTNSQFGTLRLRPIRVQSKSFLVPRYQSKSVVLEAAWEVSCLNGM